MKERLVLWVSKVILNLELHLKKVRLNSSEGLTRSEHIVLSSTFVDSVLTVSGNVLLLLFLLLGLSLLGSSWNSTFFNIVIVALVFPGLALLCAWCDIVIVDSTNAGFRNIVLLALVLLLALFVSLKFTEGSVVVVGGINSIGM